MINQFSQHNKFFNQILKNKNSDRECINFINIMNDIYLQNGLLVIKELDDKGIQQDGGQSENKNLILIS
ncbi:hypothetical protein pb186bvf_020454 [Paramecium bursaria]